MRTLIGLFLALAVAGVTLAVVVQLATGGELTGCPLALVEGTLVDRDGTLAVAADQGEHEVVAIRWPVGYAVGDEGGTLVLSRLFGTVAREGDHVSMGGGANDDGSFTACGTIAVRPAGASPTPSPGPSPSPMEIEEVRVAVPGRT